MNFLLSEDQLALLDGLAALLRDRCDAQHVHKLFDTPGEAVIDTALWAQLVEFGVPAIFVPEQHGGLGLEMIDLAIVAEALGAFAAPVPFFGHAIATVAIALGGSEAQKAKWLPRLASGELLGTITLGEGKAAWLPEEWTLSAAAPLSGVKTLVPNAAEADLIVVGVTEGLAIVAKGAGIVTARLDGADRTRPLDTVTFEGATAELLEDGKAATARLIDAAAVLLAADAFGGAERCVQMSVDYARMREQYGVQIGQFQGLRYQLVKMALATEPSRGLYWYAAHAWGEIPEQASHAAAQAKAHLTDTYLQVTRDTVEAHGGIGFTWEHDTHIYMKRAMWDWAWLGAPSRHRLRAAELIGW
ncbi:MAG: acyl-CoA/acyl-ACP dehydrogenase [Sphingomonadaceae bacterium]|nr:acyl-CoA/acyl-ACP dehydrogenase [Sphingomonadaceae bacterium]